MPISKKILILLSIVSVALAIALFFFHLETERGQRLAEARRQAGDADLQLQQLARDIQKFNTTRSQLGADGGNAMARHEKVALAAHLSPAELARINDIFARAYTQDGFLLVKSFSMHWSGTETGASLSLELGGEKVFVR